MENAFSGFEFAMGSVFGHRAWFLEMDGLRSLNFPTFWKPGVNEATCLCDLDPMCPCGLCQASSLAHSSINDDHHLANHVCGFYAYYADHPNAYVNADHAVQGVVEGYGKTILGTRGFRCTKARVVALYAPSPEAVEHYWRDRGTVTNRFTAVYTEKYTALREAYKDVPVFDNREEMLLAHPPSTMPEEVIAHE